MKYLRRIFIMLLIPAVLLNLFIPRLAFAGQEYMAADAGSRQYLPESLSSPEQDVPVEEIKKSSKTWLWILLVVAVAGGAAAAAGGGGGGSAGGGGGSRSGGGAIGVS